MAEITGVTVNVKEISRSFYTARKSIRIAIMNALEKSGPKIVSSVKRKAPRLRGNLKAAMAYKVKYKTGEASLGIIATNKTVDIYFPVREYGPSNGGVITGDPMLAWVPKFSPLWSKTATVASAKRQAEAQGYSLFMRGNLLLGSKRKGGKGRRRAGNRVGADFISVAVIVPSVKQYGKPYVGPAFEENLPSIQERIIKELGRIFKEK